MKEQRQETLFDLPPDWDEHWQDMPEFIQENQQPYKTIYLHFDTQADVDAFSCLIGQTITSQTRFIWYPEKKPYSRLATQYIDGEGHES